ncbi:universal stress protein [Portibacter lacus]|uniref:UspA domain-containing protein n=1 Tax=Portibacter lacus TaxID=1099794 RepID=A0AA37WG35_9BACT|nr:universal stress protein [Portibacter lacus]GLR19408.1 hypothetical protein GCM10007940_40240 [Portibacter lacus]
MKNKKYKIAVFTDLKKSASETIKSTLKLAKIINGDIEVFNVKSLVEIIKRDNQLTAVRSLKDQHILTRQKLIKLIEPINEESNIDVKFSFAFGNVKKELASFIDQNQPDIIVLGKRRPKLINFIGDSITDFVLQKHPGLIMIADQKNTLKDSNELTLGLLNSRKESFSSELVENLMEKTEMPLRSFKVLQHEEDLRESNPLNTKKAIEYVFEQNDQAVNSISNYLSRSKVNLLFVKRNDAEKNKSNDNSRVKKLIAKSDVSILFA